jgi:hypothetical protein
MRISLMPSRTSAASTAKRLGARSTSAAVTLFVAIVLPLTVTSYVTPPASSPLVRR